MHIPHVCDLIRGHVPMSAPQFQVFVRVPRGDGFKTITCSITHCDRVTNLKVQVAQKLGTCLNLARIDPEEQQLLFAGKIMEDKCMITDYNLQRESTVHLSRIAACPGGGCTTSRLHSLAAAASPAGEVCIPCRPRVTGARAILRSLPFTEPGRRSSCATCGR